MKIPEHPHTPFYWRRHWTRRRFFHLLGGAVTASVAMPPVLRGNSYVVAPVETKSTARNVIFILLSGAPSHIDTFDFKMVDGVTPESLAPETFGDVVWPVGLLPDLAQRLDKFAIVRSVRAWALVHSLAQTWAQIGRSPAAALGDIAPHVGSIVAVEKAAERRDSDVLPAFLALNANGVQGQGFLPAGYAPFKHTAAASTPQRGLSNVAAPAAFGARWDLLNALDKPLRQASPLGQPAVDFAAFYEQARRLMEEAQPGGAVDRVFKFTAEDVERYGNTNFGAACLVAHQALAANRGTRFVQVNLGGWDHHQNIYAENALPALSRQLDRGVAALLDDLESSGSIAETLVVMMGEFGRTVGPLSAAAGRDHYLQQFAMFAGAGVRGGRIIGATDAEGRFTTDPGWSRNRDVRVEDIEATIYSALGINWTTIRTDEPTGRGYELVPLSSQDVYGPIHDLWDA